MWQKGEEHDYLAGTQLEVDPDSFTEVVKEAFLLEHGVSQHQDIAAILGVDKSRVSQIFKRPEDLKPESVRTILAHLSKGIYRRRVLRAWNRVAFGEVHAAAGLIEGNADEKALRRIDRMIRESRLSLAARLAEEVSEKAKDLSVQEQAFDRRYWCRQRLDEPGRSMTAVRQIVERSRARGDYLREAAGHLMRSWVLMRLTDCRPQELDPIFSRVEALVGNSQPPEPLPKYILVNASALASTRQNARLFFIERGILPLDHRFLDLALEQALARAKTAKSYQIRSQAWQTASRIYTLQGNSFLAAEAIDRAFEAGSIKNLQVFELNGVLMSQVQRQTEDLGQAIAYLTGVAQNCRASEDRYHLRLVEWELARLESAAIEEGKNGSHPGQRGGQG